MKKFVCRAIVAAAVTATGIVTTTTGAFAQAVPADEAVNFTGTVGSVCMFSNNVSGTLMVDAIGNQLASDLPGATMGAVDLDCTGGVDISVSTPQDNGSTTDLLSGATFYNAAAEVASMPGVMASNDNSGADVPTGAIAGPFSDTLNVNMMIDAGTPIPAGAYDYNVMVTATPQ